VDYDADLSPFFALNEKEIQGVGKLRRLIYQYQWLYLPLFLVGNAFNVVFSGWVYLLRQLANPKTRSAQHWIDLGMLLLHNVVWVGSPMLFFPIADVLLFTLVRFALMSYAMFALFAPAHFPAEAVMIEPDASDLDSVHRQTLTTVNFRTGWLGRLLCGGVEYQIEHHLFPSVSPTHYPRLSKHVRAYCEEHGYPYRTLGWGEAIWKSLLAFCNPKPVVSNLREALAAAKIEAPVGREMAYNTRGNVTG
jgi:fatty acid desaturase